VAIDLCSSQPDLLISGPERHARCFRWQEIANGALDAGQEPRMSQAGVTGLSDSELVLDIDQLEVRFLQGRSLGDWADRKPVKEVQAVNQVSLQIRPSQILGLAGAGSERLL
jgi:ABC-type glutathione transport system ATPase component